MAIEKDRWKYRRMMVFGGAGFIGTLIAYLVIFGQHENAVQLAAIQSLPLAWSMVVMTYIGGAVADDALQLRVNKS